MARVSLGLVGIVDKGEYNPSTTYNKGDFVYYLGSTYLCLLDNRTGVTPSNDKTNWKFLARGFEEVDSVVLEDDETSTRYKVGISSGVLFIEESDADPNAVILTDTDTQKKYKLGISGALLYTQEIS